MRGGLPVEALIGDGLAPGQFGLGTGETLTARHEVAFEHGPGHVGVSGGSLADDFLEDGRHASLVLAAVGVGAVEVGIHDESLLSHRGAGFLEVDPNDHEDLVLHLVGEAGESFGLGKAGFGVVDRARTNDEEESGVRIKKGLADGFAGREDEIALPRGREPLPRSARQTRGAGALSRTLTSVAVAMGG